MWCCSWCSPGEAVGPPCHKGMLQAHCPFRPPEPSLQSCFPASQQLCRCTACRSTGHYFFPVSSSYCHPSECQHKHVVHQQFPLSFVSSTNLLKVRSVLWSRSSGKIMNCVGPSISHWSTPLVPGLRLDFMLLTTTLWAQQFSQFSKHLTIHLSSLYFTSLSRRILWDTLL